jgi:prepilin-type N-terminal cleavage/methylation domain-containing protein
MRSDWPPSSRRGLTLVEVLVALSVLTVNVIAISGMLLVAMDLTGRIERIATTLEEGVVVPPCGVMAIPWLSLRALRPGRDRRRALRLGRSGFTLVEVVVALALVGLLLVVLAAFVSGGLRASTMLTARAVEQEARIALPAIITELVETAGAGIRAPECALEVAADARALVLSRVAPDGSSRVEEVFAALDGGGRPALFLRHRPHARQPWLEDVTSFEVVRVARGEDGRLDAVELRLVHAGASHPIDVVVPLPHRPCHVGAP